MTLSWGERADMGAAEAMAGMAGVARTATRATTDRTLEDVLAELETSVWDFYRGGPRVRVEVRARLQEIIEEFPRATGSPRLPEEIRGEIRRLKVDLVTADSIAIADESAAHLAALYAELAIASGRPEKVAEVVRAHCRNHRAPACG